MKLVTPDVPEGLKINDGYHLDGPSAERLSQAFFQAAGPEIRSCLEKHGAGAREPGRDPTIAQPIRSPRCNPPPREVR